MSSAVPSDTESADGLAVDAITAKPDQRHKRTLSIATVTVIALIALIAAIVAGHALPAEWIATVVDGVQSRGFWTAAAVGLGAQIVDGALGMAYGVTSTTFLLSTGVPPAAASASVHIAEIFTTGFSGLSHFKLGNVDTALFKRLVIPGVVGGLIGAYVLTSIDGNVVKPFVSAYLLLIGLYILSKVWRTLRVKTEPPKYVAPLALTGGFVDAIGGGGWGPVVTTSLIGGGNDPRTTIGSVNAAEFFIAISTGLSFSVLGGLTHWTVIAGLVFGGLFAAPFAAVLTRYAPPRLLLLVVGLLIASISSYNLGKLL
ncbi:MAG: sulfite exporter TauE/SafE family protein [Burkholderiaceae bacterium]